MHALAHKGKKPQPRAADSSARSRAVAPTASHLVHPILHLQRAIGNQAVQRLLSESLVGVQPKLTVSSPGDAGEREADRASDQVMGMAEPPLQRSGACDGACATCQQDQPGEKAARVQFQHVQASDAVPIAASHVQEVVRSPGEPLDLTTRAFMEPRFGHDFSHVRVHADEIAGNSARAVNALAYTVGLHLVFGVGQYSPTTYLLDSAG